MTPERRGNSGKNRLTGGPAGFPIFDEFLDCTKSQLV
jgi:hypothetical protein